MPKASKKSAWEEVQEVQAQRSTHPDSNESSQEEIPSSDQESDLEVIVNPHRPLLQVVPSMFMPYIEGPKMDWTVNDGLYHRFLKWHLKCENILECELAALPERQQCKKVIAWSGDFGMDQYVSWGLPTDQLTLDIIWDKFEDFCKLQSNEVCARFDLLTSFRQGNRSIDEWYNAVQAQVNLAKYPPETAKILQRDIFWFFLHDEEFVSKTISDGSADLDKFPTSKVRQLAKKLESSKATAHQIKQVAGDPQAAQINLLRHQRTELPAGKYKKKRSNMKPRQSGNKHQGYEGYHSQAQPKKKLTPEGYTMTGQDVPNVEIQFTWRGSNAQRKNTNVKLAISLVISPVCVFKRSKLLTSKRSSKHTSYRQAVHMYTEVPHMTTQMKTALLKNHSACS